MAATYGLTAAGLANMADTGKARFLYIAVGTGSQAFSEALNTMQTELTRKAVGDAMVVGNVLYLSVLFDNNEANGTLTEWGVFDALSGGTMQAYGVDPVPPTKTSAAPLVYRVVVPLENKA